MDISNVLEEYRKGDEAKRLSLFMAYRELREQFTMIEDNEGSDFVIFSFPWSRKRKIARAA